MRYLKAEGYRVVSLRRLRGVHAARRQLPRRAVVLTFDDGYRAFKDHAYPILKELGFTATLFVYTDYVGRGPQRALAGRSSASSPPRASTSRPTRKTHADLRRTPGETDAQYSRRMQAELAAAAGPLPAQPRPPEPDPRLSLRARDDDLVQEGARSTATSPPSRCAARATLVRRAAARPPQPDLLRDDARRLRQEPERLPGARISGEARRAASWLAAVLGACATAGSARAARRWPARPGTPAVACPPAAPAPRPPASASSPSTAAATAQFERGGAAPPRARGVEDRADHRARRRARPAAARARLEAHIEGRVAERVARRARRARRGVAGRGPAQFLSALALDPGNRAAFDALQSRGARRRVHHARRAGRRHAVLARPALLRRPLALRGDLGDQPAAAERAPGRGHPPQDSRDPRRALRLRRSTRPGPRGGHPHADGRDGPAPCPKPGAPDREEPPEVNPLLADARRRSTARTTRPPWATWTSSCAAARAIARRSTSRRSRSTARARASSTSASTTSPIRTLSQLVKLQPDYEDAPKLLQPGPHPRRRTALQRGHPALPRGEAQGGDRRMARGARARSRATPTPAQHRPGRAPAAWSRSAHEKVVQPTIRRTCTMNRHVRTVAPCCRSSGSPCSSRAAPSARR